MDEFSSNVFKRLPILTDLKKTIFAYWCCKRLLPNYVKFNELENWGDINVLLDALNYLEAYLINDEYDEGKIRELLRIIDDVIPNTNDFDTIYASFALDACSSIYETLLFLKDKKNEHIISVGSLMRDTVDIFIQEKEKLDYNDPNFEVKIKQDPFMINELNRQTQFLEKLLKYKGDNLVNVLNSYDAIIDLSLL
ncbi:DUF416 family protein [Fulvivirga sp. M361]|uniref:DUF416 family protein n=1 Tax=Fulvivirga sp. M361 TaxID=2594266 RepID=UPI00117B2C5A|nr:DUF416 family protein [Fulvivirga sp. M361]TRX60097.1 DUF416 family protein [Fulvivirga sp. M361]